jgi:hypothetical protein
LNYQESARIKTFYNEQVMRLHDILQIYGMPGLTLPSANLYSAHMKYSVDLSRPNVHPALALMNARHFNIDATKDLISSVLQEAASPLTYNQLLSGMSQTRSDRNI